MQDNNKIDQQFEDKSWDNMRVLLDKDLPVKEEKKRRWIPFFFILLTGMLIGTGITKWMMSTPIENKTPVVDTPIEMADNSKKSNTSTSITNETISSDNINTTIENKSENLNYSTSSKNSKTTITNSISKNKIVSKDNSISLTEKTSSSGKINTSQLTTNNQEPTPHKYLTTHDKQLTLNTPQQTANNNQLTTNSPEQTTTNKQTIEKIIDRKNWNTNSISLLDLQPFENDVNDSYIYDPFVSDKLEGKLVSISSPKPWSWMLHAGFGSNLKDRYHFNIGGMVARDLGKKWTLESGLLFEFEKRNSTILSFTRSDNAFAAGETEDENSTEPDLSNVPSQSFDPFYSNRGLEIVEVYNKEVTNSYRLKIPLNAIYKMNHKFHLVGGIYGQYTFNTQNVNNPDLDLADMSSSESFNSIINKFNLGLQTGIRYWPNRKLGIQLSYSQNIQPEISPNFFKSANSLSSSSKNEYINGSLNIGLRYKF